MMNYYGRGWGMMGGSAMGIVGLLTWIAVFVDLVLLGIWLWQNIKRK